MHMNPFIWVFFRKKLSIPNKKLWKEQNNLVSMMTYNGCIYIYVSYWFVSSQLFSFVVFKSMFTMPFCFKKEYKSFNVLTPSLHFYIIVLSDEHIAFSAKLIDMYLLQLNIRRTVHFCLLSVFEAQGQPNSKFKLDI